MTKKTPPHLEPEWLARLSDFAGNIDWPSLTYSQLYTIRYMRPALADAATTEMRRRGRSA